ncbi:MAG: DNA polymerase III subunit alpha [Arenicellales bacterium]
MVDSILRINNIIDATAEQYMPAVAVTDLSNVFSVVKFYKAAMAAGIKPVLGSDVWIERAEQPGKPFRLVLLCKDEKGYCNLTHMLSEAFRHGQHLGGHACISKQEMAAHSDGLIALSAATQGEIGNALLHGSSEQVDQLVEEYLQIFGDCFYLELQRTGRPGDEEHVVKAMDLAARHSLPVVATNDVRFRAENDFEIHDIRVCIQDSRVLNDPRRPKLYSSQQYFRSSEEMAGLFADIPEAIENTYQIAMRCNCRLTLGKNFMPEFPVAEGQDVNQVLIDDSNDGLKEILKKVPQEVDRGPYQERLDMELDVITGMGFPGYFLIVADFIRWAKDHDIPVGPGRGSGAGSLVAYCLGITELDPIEHGLLFERFLNPERVSMPDFDIDFCMDKRDRVIEYVTQHYGADKVSQIITYGTMAARAVVRDVGRVMDVGFGFVDQLAKMIPGEPGMTLTRAIESEKELREKIEQDDDVRELISRARSLEGMARNAGKHAGGVVIAPTALTDFTALYCEQGVTQMVTHLDMKDVEAVGLVKFDFLGLRTLTIIDNALKTVNRFREKNAQPPMTLEDIDLSDKKTFKLIQACGTTAVFQLESSGMKDVIKKLQPDNFDDMVAVVALYRPGPLGSGMVDTFIERKHGREKIIYPHPLLEEVLKPTYGVIVYQEQVMQIAQILASFTLGAADMLRRAMGKKIAEEMAKQRKNFQAGAEKNGIDARQADSIFDLMEEFAKYGFNKSHSAAYALVSFQTAWFKAHYPAMFLASTLSADMEKTEKVVTLIAECRDMELTVQPPDVNSSGFSFEASSEDTIVYGLGAIKGIGQAAIEEITRAREEKGQFSDLYDFCRALDLKKVNQRTLETLIGAGALDNMGVHRAALMANLANAMSLSGQELRNRAAGQDDLFGSSDELDLDIDWIEVAEYSEDERLKREKKHLGLYLTGHPMNQYHKELSNFISCSLSDVESAEGKQVTIAGLIIAMRTRNTRRGRMAILTLDDQSAWLEIPIYSELYDSNKQLLQEDRLVIISGKAGYDDYTGGTRVTAERIHDMDSARETFATDLRITLKKKVDDAVDSLQAALQPVKGGSTPVIIDYMNEVARASIHLPREWCVHPSARLLDELNKLPAVSKAVCEYNAAGARMN